MRTPGAEDLMQELGLGNLRFRRVMGTLRCDEVMLFCGSGDIHSSLSYTCLRGDTHIIGLVPALGVGMPSATLRVVGVHSFPRSER
jgi:hypothetical protein